MADGGWYIDEQDPRLARWHDGAGWTDHVLVVAEWDGTDEPPPPREAIDWGTPPGGWPRWLVAPAALLLVLFVVAVAWLDDGGSEDPAVPGSSDREAPEDDDLSPGTDATLSGIFDPASAVEDGADAVDVGGSAGTSGTRSSGGRSSSPSPSSSGSSSGGVRRTETSSRSQSNTSPITAAGPRDETNVGNRSSTSITAGYTPPPPSATSTTAASPSSTNPTSPPPSTPPTQP